MHPFPAALRPAALLAALLALAACAPAGGGPSSAAAPPGPAPASPAGTWDGSVTDPVYLTVDGTKAAFPSMARYLPSSGNASAKGWDLGALGLKPYPALRTYVSLVVETSAAKSITDPALTAADITSVTVDVTQAYDTTHSVGWTLTVANPSSVPGARFYFVRSGKTVSVHLEGAAVLRGPNPGTAPAAPTLVFQTAEVPIVP